MVSNVFTYYNTERRDSQQHERCECILNKPMNTNTPQPTTIDYSDENQKTIVKEEEKPTTLTPTSTPTPTTTIPIIMSNSKPINISTSITNKSHQQQIQHHRSSHHHRSNNNKQGAKEVAGSPSISTKTSESNTDLVAATNSSESSSLNSPVHLLSPPTSTASKSRLNSTSMNSYSSTTNSNSTILNTTATCCSSVPTVGSYESYTTIYKRLMRSLSNSLISGENNPEDAETQQDQQNKQQQPSFKRSQFSSSRENVPECNYATISPPICQKCVCFNSSLFFILIT
jgi:hypothetical protein